MTGKKMPKHLKGSLTAAVLGGIMVASSASAAKLVAGGASDYASSTIGYIEGSRVTTDVVANAIKDYITDVNGDTAVITYNHNGAAKIAIRQYVMGGTSQVIPTRYADANGNWQAYAKSEVPSEPNIRAIASKGDYLYVTGYDNGKIGIEQVGSGGNTTEVSSVDLKSDLNKNCGANYGATAGIHGEGILINGNKLFVIVSPNPVGGYEPYDEAYLMKYNINTNGTLSFEDYARTAKNPDSISLELYNDYIFCTGTGGYQANGSSQGDNSYITAVNINNMKGDVTKIYKNDGMDFHHMKVLPDGTAYIAKTVKNIDGASIKTRIYKTTVSNLIGGSADNWEIVRESEVSGWFVNVDADYYTKRLYVEEGRTYNVYTDGAAEALQFTPESFTTNVSHTALYGSHVIGTDKVTGALAMRSDLPVNDTVIVKPAQRNYAKKISGTNADTAYTAVTSDYSTYTFNGNTSVYLTDLVGDFKTNVSAAVDAHAGNDIKIEAGSNELQLNSNSTVGNPSGIYAGAGKNVTVNAGKVSIFAINAPDGNSLTNAVWLDAPKSGKSTITINSPLNITIDGGAGGNGIAISKTSRILNKESSFSADAASEIIVNGNVKIAGTNASTWGIGLNGDNVYSRFNNAGILTSVEKAKVTVNGLVDFAVYGNGITTNAKESVVSVNGGRIIVPSGMKYGYYTLGAYQGTINVNSDGSSAGDNEVRLEGDVFALKTGTINLGLTTANSYLKGIVDSGGTANMWLTNGATWTNAMQNTRYKEDNEDVGAGMKSFLTNLYGGMSASDRGAIFMGDKSLTVNNFSGNVLALYAHDASNPATIKGADFIVKKAASGSTLTLRTDSTGINTSNITLTNNVLNALANKLYYEAYKNGENNLLGKVEIAEGLTSSSVSKVMGLIDYNSSTGQGSYSGRQEEKSADDFIKFVRGQSQASFTADDNLAVKSDVGVIKTAGTAKSLTANFANHSLRGYGKTASTGMEVADTYTFTLNGSGANSQATITNFNTAFDNKGTLNLNNVQLSGNKQALKNASEASLNNVTVERNDNAIANTGKLTLKGKTVINDEISGTGTIEVKSGDVSFGNTVSQAKLTADASSKISATAGNLSFTSGIENLGTLTLSDGTLTSAVSGAGKTEIDGTVTANANIGQAIKVNANKSLTASANNVGGAVENLGTLTLIGGTLAQAVSGTGTTTIDGEVAASANIGQAVKVNANKSLTASANNVGGAVENLGALKLTGGTLAQAVTGAGTTTIDGEVTASADIAQAVTINASKSLTASANNLGGTVANNGALKLSGGTLTKAVSGTGTTTIDGTVTVSETIAQNVTVNAGKTLSSELGKLGGTVTNNGMFEMTGNISKNITGTGTTKLMSDKAAVSADRNIAGTLDANGKTIDMQQLGAASFSTLSLGTLKGSANLKIDADMAGAKSDEISATSADNATLNLTSINVTADKDVAGNFDDYLTYAAIGSGTTNYRINGSDTGSLVTYTSNYKYTFTKGADGKLDVAQVISTQGLSKFIKGELETNTDTFSITKDTQISDPGAIGTTNNGTYKTLNLSVNKNTLTGYNADKSTDGITVAQGYALNLAGKSASEQGTVEKFKKALVVANGGTLNAENLKFADNVADIENSGTLNLKGNIDIESGIKGSGTTNIESGTTKLNATLVQGKLSVKSGANAEGAADNFAANTIENLGTVTLKGGTLAKAIAGAGKTVIDGAVTASANLGQAVTINATKSLTASADNIGGAVTNNGALTLSGGTLGRAISGTGTTEIDGIVTANAALSQAVKVKSGKELITDAANLKGAFANSGTISLTGGTLASEISGGNVSVKDGNVTIAKKQNAIALNIKSGSLVMNTTSDYLADSDLTLSGSGVLDMQDGAKSLNEISVKSLKVASDATKASGVKFDADLEALTNDKINVGTAASGNLNLRSINLKSGFDGAVGTTKEITLVNGGSLTGLTLGTTSTNFGAYRYVFTQAAEGGKLSVKKEWGYTLPEIIQNSDEKHEAGRVDTFSLSEDMKLTEDLGTLTRPDKDKARTFTINGNSLYGIDGNGNRGIIVNTDDTLNLENVKAFKGFNGAAITNYSNHTVNITGDVDFDGNDEDIKNEGTLNFNGGSVNFTSGITGGGTTNVKNTAHVVMSKETSLAQKNLNIEDGSLTAYADKLLVSETLKNDDELVLLDGENKNNITGSGKTKIEGDVISQGTIKSKDLAVGKDASLVANSELESDIENEGKLTINESTRGALKNSAGGIVDINLSGDKKLLRSPIINNGTINLKLEDGATWENTGTDDVYINSIQGGESNPQHYMYDKAGLIKQGENSGKITVGKLSGSVSTLYGFDEKAGTVKGGDLAIETVGDNASVRVLTQSQNIDMKDKAAVQNVLNLLAEKLVCTNPDENKKLFATTAIAEGLTSSMAAKAGTIVFGADGKGEYGEEYVDSDITFGDEETRMMRGVKATLTNRNMLWRAQNNDVQKRLGDIHLGNIDYGNGIWATYNGGKLKHRGDKIDVSTSYNGFQVGYDKSLNEGWRAGVAFSHANGRSTSETGNTRDTISGVSVYGTWVGDKGHYTDIIVKGTHVKNKFKTYNTLGYLLDGSTAATGLSFSAEYGRRIETGANGFYYEPQIELTLGYMPGDNFEGNSIMGKMYVDSGDFKSVLARIGFGIGQKTDKFSYYAKANLLHEFCGSFDTRYASDGGPTKYTSSKLGGTWGSVQLGATLKMSKSSNFYANIEKTIGGKVKTDWRIDAGFRFEF